MEAKQLTRSAAQFLPRELNMPSLRIAAADCKGCSLYRQATQTVFGEGSGTARVVLIGEVPGNQEDKVGRPFIGPAGRLLRRALADAGISEDDVYITNAVKHFKSVSVGARKKGLPPTRAEVLACRPWLEAELGVIKPRALMCLGATAAHAVLGRVVRIKDVRDEAIDTQFGLSVFITVHPSSLLRAGQFGDTAEEYRRFMDDLKRLLPYCA